MKIRDINIGSKATTYKGSSGYQHIETRESHIMFIYNFTTMDI